MRVIYGGSDVIYGLFKELYGFSELFCGLIEEIYEFSPIFNVVNDDF